MKDMYHFLITKQDRRMWNGRKEQQERDRFFLALSKSAFLRGPLHSLPLLPGSPASQITGSHGPHCFRVLPHQRRPHCPHPAPSFPASLSSPALAPSMPCLDLACQLAVCLTSTTVSSLQGQIVFVHRYLPKA